eukprot:CAMPEP_0194377930 /NCGR_PEP_ID=MMETSP0174-20130528/33043_1 /TAXON_ID=216777 /ORGANISM="Proboscia alata, Strain PI-D3" /LENGTH=68 /DNA_ID=CAMNT_0039159595 /DNA_START=30 /DNA_END=232 /DNA_ORIENTATION=+
MKFPFAASVLSLLSATTAFTLKPSFLRTTQHRAIHSTASTLRMSDDTYDYDLVVIGGGSGGVRASRIA